MHPTALDAAALEELISAAVAAPSIHNTQPWRFRLDPATSTLHVRAVQARELAQADPEGRALHISVGAALYNLRVAVEHRGWEPVVRLLPHPSEPDLLASVRLSGPPRSRKPDGPDLYEMVWRRHSSRLPYLRRQLPPEVLRACVEAAAAEGATLRLPGPEESRRLLGLTAEAEWRNREQPARRAESRSWIRDTGPYGLPPAALGPQDAAGHMPVRDFSALEPGRQKPSVVFEDQPVIAVLTTKDDRPADWLRAGQALERVLLVATAHTVRASLLHQALEWPDLRWELRDVHAGPHHVQMLLRMGYGPEGAATSRTSVREVLEEGPEPPPPDRS